MSNITDVLLGIFILALLIGIGGYGIYEHDRAEECSKLLRACHNSVDKFEDELEIINETCTVILMQDCENKMFNTTLPLNNVNNKCDDLEFWCVYSTLINCTWNSFNASCDCYI